MPNIGDEIRGKEIGKVADSAKRQLHVWVRCPYCLKERWAQKKSSWNRMSNRTRLCILCARNNAKTFRINPRKAAEEGRI